MVRPGDIGSDDTGVAGADDATGGADSLATTGTDSLAATGARDRPVATVSTGVAPRVSDPALARTELGGDAVPRREGHLAPGTRVGRYVIGNVLGEGGMGTVYVATDPDLGREVAVKLVRGDLAGSQPATRRRMVREAQAMARISHANVIAVHDAGTFGGDVFIAMELVRGRSLRAWLAAAPRSVADVLEAYLAAGRGLAAAHAAGLVHRDFKPDNVLVGDDGRVRVTDFGLAVADGDVDLFAAGTSGLSGNLGDSGHRSGSLPGSFSHGADSPFTVTAGIVGTPPYMAPEQHGGGVTDARSDQFSFCVSLYEALHGERPFAGRTRDEVGRAIRAGHVSPPPATARVPGSLRALLLRGLSVRPGDRFDTMDSLLRALGRDRGRLPRRIASVAAVALLIVAVAFGADGIVRDRADAVTRTDFAAARGQLGRLIALRTEAFAATSDLVLLAPVLREVAGTVDQADFGLGAEADDQTRLAEIHEHLASADWVSWARTIQGGDFAVADYKGRLLYASASPARWGNDVTALPAIAIAYRTGSSDPRAAVVRGDSPEVIASGLFGDAARPGLHVLFSRVIAIGDQPRALFVQAMSGARLLSEVSLGEGTLMGLAALDGASLGPVPSEILAAGLRAGDDVEEIVHDRQTWLVQRYPMRSGDQLIANIVLARRVDVGLAGLFPGARGVLAVLALVLAAMVVGGVALARGRDLNRHALRAVRREPPRREPPVAPPPVQRPPSAPMPSTQVSES